MLTDVDEMLTGFVNTKSGGTPGVFGTKRANVDVLTVFGVVHGKPEIRQHVNILGKEPKKPGNPIRIVLTEGVNIASTPVNI